MRRIPLALCLAALTLGALAHPMSAAPADHYWQLGVGYYGLDYPGETDVARFDWIFLCFGNVPADEATVAKLNRMLRINPRLKILIRVWPIGSLGDCKENSYQATFLHYLYAPGVKEKLLAETRNQIRVVLDHIRRPENVIGTTFLEELPYHFSGAPFDANKTGGELSWDLARFRAEIEAERGKPLVWDDETRKWWGEKWCQVINEITAEMKKASDGRLVFYYQQTNHSSLDMVPEGTPLDQPMLMPIHWTDIIKPGLCDGFFAYPNSQQIWDGYLRLAREYDWPFFSQVAHPPYRLCSWEDHLRLAETRVPQNLGYFFYCEGNCTASKAWNVDPGIPEGPEWNTPSSSIKTHVRRHLAVKQVGMDVLARQPALRLYLDLPLNEAVNQQWLYLRAIVENVREASCYLDPDDAVARGVTVALGAPPDFPVDEWHTGATTVEVGDLAPGDRRMMQWWLPVPEGFDGRPEGPFVVTASAQDSPPTDLRARADTTMPFGEPQEINASGTEWMEVPYRLASDTARPAISIEPLGAPVHGPAVGDGSATVRYAGTVEDGTRLVLEPPDKARLFALPLFDDRGESRADPADATGFRAFDEGYHIVNQPVRRAVEPGRPLRVTIAGKAEDGAQSLVYLRFGAKDEPKDVSLLVNSFSADWREVSETAPAPEGAESLQNVFLYRFGQVGRIWYGPLRIERADIDPTGLDVSDRLQGTFPTLSRNLFSVFRYTDEDPATQGARVRVQVSVPDE